MKPGIRIEIPGFGEVELRSIVSDYTGTHSRRGRVTEGVRHRSIHLSGLLDIHILTADTFGTVERELKDIPLAIHRLHAEKQDEQKMEFVKALGPQHVAAFGNGSNDRLLMKTARDAGGIAIAVDNGEGCAGETLQNASLFIAGSENALDLLIETNGLKGNAAILNRRRSVRPSASGLALIFETWRHRMFGCPALQLIAQQVGVVWVRRFRHAMGDANIVGRPIAGTQCFSGDACFAAQSSAYPAVFCTPLRESARFRFKIRSLVSCPSGP